MVKAVFIAMELRCTGHTKAEITLPPGTCHWEFYDPPSNGVEASLNFVCPCGCGEVDFVFVSKVLPKVARCWQWDGNKESPTLTPSIYRLGAACKWHGWLRAGEFVQA